VPIAQLGGITSKIGSGATPKGGDSAYKDEGTPLIRSMNVRDGEFSERGLAYLDDQQAGKLSNVIVQANDVLLNITGASVARVCLAPPQMEGARVNQHVSIIRPSKSITSEFLEAFLLMPRTKRKLLTIAEGGATRQAITKAQIEELEVPVPDLARQQDFIERLKLARKSVVAMASQSIGFEAMFASLQHRAFRGEL
jgi:type I restriction enzyme, S subunit